MGLGYVGSFGAKGGQEGFDHWMQTRLEAELEAKRQQQQALDNAMREKVFTSNEELKKAQLEDISSNRLAQQQATQRDDDTAKAEQFPAYSEVQGSNPAVPSLQRSGFLRSRGNTLDVPDSIALGQDSNPALGGNVTEEDPGTIANSPYPAGRLYTKMPTAAQTKDAAAVLQHETEHRDQVARQKETDAATAEYRQQNLNIQRDRAAAARQTAAAADVQLSQAAKEQAADQYSAGTPLSVVSPGSGNAANAKRTEIQNLAAIRHPGVSLVLVQAGLKADQSSLTSMTKMHDAVRAFERTAESNSQEMMRLAQKLTDTGSPLLNRPIREFSRITGNDDVSAFDVARQTIVNEYSKILTNPNLTGQLTEGQQREVDNLLSGNMTLRQIGSALRTLQLDAKNREDSTLTLLNEIRARIGTGSGPTPNATVDVPKPQTVAPPAKKQIRYDENGQRLP